MPEQITLYQDAHDVSAFCYRVKIALLEVGARYTTYGFDIHNKPEWFTTKVNPVTGKVPAITYGGPIVPPEEPSPLSFKLTESSVILDFLADLFPNSHLLPPASDPTARARVRLFMDVFSRLVEAPLFELAHGKSDVVEKILAGLEKFQTLLPDPDAVGGEFAFGKDFTNADCAIAPLLAFLELVAKTDLGGFELGTGKKLADGLAGGNFKRLRRYETAIFERESVKKVIDFDRIETLWRARFTRE